MKIRSLVRHIFLLPIYFYQKIISPYLSRSCIYSPSCSAFFVESVHKHGIIKGFVLGVARISRCQATFFIGGLDQVPDHFSCKEVKNPYIIFRRKRDYKN